MTLDLDQIRKMCDESGRDPEVDINCLYDTIDSLRNNLNKLISIIHPHELAFAHNDPIAAIKELNRIRERWMCWHGGCRHLDDNYNMYCEIQELKNRIWRDHEHCCWVQGEECPALLPEACEICTSLWEWKYEKEEIIT